MRILCGAIINDEGKEDYLLLFGFEEFVDLGCSTKDVYQQPRIICKTYRLQGSPRPRRNPEKSFHRQRGRRGGYKNH